MLSILRKISSLTLLLILFFGFSAPQAFAQGSLFEEPLEAIEEKLEEEGIKVIEYSEEDWGNLPTEIIIILEGEGFESLENFANYAGYDQELGNVDVLINELELIEELSSDDINLIVNEIRFKGESQFQSIILSLAKVMRNLLAGFAIIWIIISGVQMVTAGGDESKITEQKRSITYAVIGLAVILVLERMIVLVYGVPGVERGFVERPEEFSQEIFGIVSFIKALIGAAAILMIIISGFKTITAVGDEEKITKQRKSIIWIIVGIVIILINQFIVENLYIKPIQEAGVIEPTNVENIINLIGKVTQFLLGFVGLIAFAALIYGAGTMIANYGNDELVQRAKKIIKNAIIGIIVIISAFAIVSTVIL